MYRIVLLFGLSISLMTSCKKGDTGPAGTANVIFSDWFKPDTYKKDTVFGIWGFNYVKDAPAVTQNILDSGSVIVYGKLLGYNPLVWPTTQVAPLPISLTYVQGSTMTDMWSGLAAPGKITIRFVNDKNYYNTIANAHQFRYVIIPGGKKATGVNGRGIMTRNGNALDLTTGQALSYGEVCRRLGIPQ